MNATDTLQSSQSGTLPVSGVPTIILALGNPLRGDDGAGQAVYTMLRNRGDLPPEVALTDGGTAGLETVLLLQGYQRAIIVDAARMGCGPGQWQRFSRHDLAPGDLGQRVTVHYAGLAEALALGEALGVLPADVIIYGIEPEQTDWAIGLSQTVQAAIPAVCTAILQEIR